MPRRLSSLVLLVVLLTVMAGCTSTSSSSGSRSSGSGVRCLDRAPSAKDPSQRAADEPDRPMFFLFCVQSP